MFIRTKGGGLIFIWDWFLSFFDKDTNTLDLSAYAGKLSTELFYKELAIQACVNLIANTVTRSEFRTYEEGKEIKRDNYYLFNVEPNPNKNANKFWRDVINKLVYENECLVIQENGYFYVADKFTLQRYAFKDYIYKGITIDGLALTDTYYEPQVLHFELHNVEIKKLIDGLYQSYAELIAASQSHYKKNNARRGKLKVPTDYPETDKATEELHNLLNNKFKRFYEAEGGAVIPLTNGMEYEELASNIGVKGGIEGRDIRAFIDDIFDFVAMAFQIPPSLIKGNIADTEKAVNNLLTFCVNPIADLITDEINRKLYRKNNYLKRTYMKLDTSNIRAVDIKDIANALDILTRIGAYSVDDCLKALGMEPIGTDWSKARWMTKNYQPIEKALKGGDSVGRKN